MPVACVCGGSAVLLIAASSVVGWPTGSTPAHAAVISAINTWLVDQLPPSQLDPQLAPMSANGVTLARRDAPWDWIEPNPPTPQSHSYHRGSTDQCAVAEMARVLTPAGRVVIADMLSDRVIMRVLDQVLRRTQRSHDGCQ